MQTPQIRCTVCHRPLTKPAATIQSRRGPLNFGPDCARRAGLTARQAIKRAALARPVRVVRCADQMELELEVSA